jgi:hypothetical protein
VISVAPLRLILRCGHTPNLPSILGRIAGRVLGSAHRLAVGSEGVG